QESDAGAVGLAHARQIDAGVGGEPVGLRQQPRHRCERELPGQRAHGPAQLPPVACVFGLNDSPFSMRAMRSSSPVRLISALTWLRKLVTSEIASTVTS